MNVTSRLPNKMSTQKRKISGIYKKKRKFCEFSLFFTSYYPHISRKDHHTCIIINTSFIPSTSHHVTINIPYILSTTLIFNAKHIWLRWFYAAANFSSNSGLRARLIGSWPEWKWIIVKRLHLWKNFDEHPLTAKTRTFFH